MPIIQLTYFNFKKEVLDSDQPVAVLCISDEDRKPVQAFEQLSKPLSGKVKLAVLNITTSPKLGEQHNAKPSQIIVFSREKVIDRMPAVMPKEMLKVRLSAIADEFYAGRMRTFR